MSLMSLIGRALVTIGGIVSIKDANAPGSDESSDIRGETDREAKSSGYDHREHEHDGYSDGHCSFDGGE